MQRIRSSVVLLVALLAIPWTTAARAAGCTGPVASGTPRIVPAAYGSATIAGHVQLTFIGHATFLIESPGGVSIATDYNDYVRPSYTPDVATMNHAHSTHYTDVVEAGVKLVLRGWNSGGGVPRYDLTFGDVHIHSVPTNIRNGVGGTEYAGNSIFEFDVGGVCIAHLGHLHHTLTPEHLADLGQVDVLLVPVDGTWTLSHEDAVTVIEQIKPPLVIPMHYFGNYVLDAFLGRLADRYPVKRSAVADVALSRDTLPASTEILVLPGR
jgi:L-ascorbate metabolism protein UlaG (beta-lactamase superfamily)